MQKNTKRNNFDLVHLVVHEIPSIGRVNLGASIEVTRRST